MIGGQLIQEFTGQYLYNMVQRDFSEGKKKLFDGSNEGFAIRSKGNSEEDSTIGD